MQTAKSRLTAAILKAAEWNTYHEAMALKFEIYRGDKVAARREKRNAKEWEVRYQALYEVAAMADDIYPLGDLSFDREIANARETGRSRAFRFFDAIAA